MVSYNINPLAAKTNRPTYIELPKTGSLPQQLNHYLQLIANPYIRLICEPLKKIQLNYFLYAKRFSNGSYIHLTNEPNWQSYYFAQHYYLIDEFEDSERNYQTGAYLWSGLSCQEIYTNMQLKFNISHGITLIQNYEDCSEFFHFGTTTNNSFMSNFYLNNSDTLKRFMLYFKDKACETIDAISQYRIKLPKKESSSISHLDALKNCVNCFNGLTAIDKYYVSNSRSDVYLTKREMECLQWYGNGKTAEEIGIILGLSRRTVEAYLTQAKNKVNSYKKGQIISSFNMNLL